MEHAKTKLEGLARGLTKDYYTADLLPAIRLFDEAVELDDLEGMADAYQEMCGIVDEKSMSKEQRAFQGQFKRVLGKRKLKDLSAQEKKALFAKVGKEWADNPANEGTFDSDEVVEWLEEEGKPKPPRKRTPQGDPRRPTWGPHNAGDIKPWKPRLPLFGSKEWLKRLMGESSDDHSEDNYDDLTEKAPGWWRGGGGSGWGTLKAVQAQVSGMRDPSGVEISCTKDCSVDPKALLKLLMQAPGVSPKTEKWSRRLMSKSRDGDFHAFVVVDGKKNRLALRKVLEKQYPGIRLASGMLDSEDNYDNMEEDEASTLTDWLDPESWS